MRNAREYLLDILEAIERIEKYTMAEVTKLIHKYLRHEKKFPHVWCPGCGTGSNEATAAKNPWQTQCGGGSP